VSERVGQGLGEQRAIARHGHARGQVQLQGESFFLGQGLVEFGHVLGQGREVEFGEILPPGPGFGLGDGQEGVEGHKQVVDGGNGAFKHGAIFLGAARLLGQRELQARADAVQGTAQIVGDVVGDLLDPVHEADDLVEHGVQIIGQTVELVPGPAAGDAPGEVAVHDLPAGPVDHVDALEHPAAGEQAAHAAEDHGQRQAPDERVDDEPFELGPFRNVPADQQVEIARQQEIPHPHAPGFEIFRVFQGGVEPARARVPKFGPFLDVAGQRIELPVRQEIHARSGLVLGHPGFDDPDEPGQPELAVLLGQALDFGVYRFVGLSLHEAGRGGVDEEQQHEHRQAEGGHVQEGQAQGGGAPELSWDHADCIRRPGWWRAGACRGPCRSSGAGG